MEKQVYEYIEKNNMICSGDFIAVGVSGGADSMCLLDLLLKYREKLGFDVAAVHVNHMLRGAEADRDEQYVRAYCNERNIVFRAFHADIPAMAAKLHLSSEEAGRRARYDAFRAVCDELAAGRRYRIAVAHHANDQAETVLFHLVRGSGIRGAAGIQPVNGNVIRPLLCVTRKQIEEYIRENAICFVTDSTNLECDYSRNRLRNKVIPYLEENINERAVENLGFFAEAAREAWTYLEKSADREYEGAVLAFDGVYLLRQEAACLDDIIRKMIIMRIMEKLTGTLKDIGAVHLNMADRLLMERTGAAAALPYGMNAVRGYKGVYIHRRETDIYTVPGVAGTELDGIVPAEEGDIDIQVIPWDKNIKIPLNDYTKLFDYDKIKGNLCVRKRQTGDYILLTPQGGKKLLKDYFIDRKIPAGLRDKITLVADGSHILWVVGFRDSAGCRIDDNTRTVAVVSAHGRTKNG